MFRKPEFPIHSEIKPWNTRLIAVFTFVGFNGACYLMGAPSIFRWLGLAMGIFCLWQFIRGAHFLFTLDGEAIAWSDDLKRKPLTRIPLAEIREVHLTEPAEAGDHGVLVLIDQADTTHVVATHGIPSNQHIWEELRRLRPAAKFGHYRDHTAVPAPNTWDLLKDVFH